MKIKGSDLFVKALEDEGVEYIFGIPGEENLDFLDSLSRSKSIKLILTRHRIREIHSKYLFAKPIFSFLKAAVYGRLTGKAGVCISTLAAVYGRLTGAYAQRTSLLRQPMPSWVACLC